MKFISTRGGMEPASFSEILVEGLAPDGGLVIPETIPVVDAARREQLRELSYAELATEILSLYATDIPRVDLAEMCRAAYSTENFGEGPAVPLTPIGNDLTLVGLSEGPTLAFKDMAMQFLGQVLEYVLGKSGSTLNIVGATSGDTGSAAEYALRGKEGISVFMLSPQGRMSAFQRAQMYSLRDDNIHNVAVDGTFDDCQNIVKQISGDIDFKRRYRVGAVNSINFGRIAAQIVYYFWAWLRHSDDLTPSERSTHKISVTVPSGNFGNILSGYLAREMGVPIHRLVLAANENNVLDEFFQSGIYRPRTAAQTHITSSPSMDIAKASNLERFIFDFFGRDAVVHSERWNALESDGVLDLSADVERLRDEFLFASGTSTHDDRVATIRSVYETSGVLIDPHTADGVKVAREFVEDGIPMLVLETAKPTKFPETIIEAIGKPGDVPEQLRELLTAPQHVIEMTNDVTSIRRLVEENALL